ncbi:hypothetical protein V8C44DRAFT_134652 [Trichoderma aethiopicum]
MHQGCTEYSETQTSIIFVGWGGCSGPWRKKPSSLYSNSARVHMARHIFRIRRIEARLANCLASGLESAPFSVWTLLFVALRWQQKGPYNTVDKKQPITVHAIMLVMHRPGLDL